MTPRAQAVFDPSYRPCISRRFAVVFVVWLAVLFVPGPLAMAQGARALSLAEALDKATKNNPRLREARAAQKAAEARADIALAPMLPQVATRAAYNRTTANFLPQPGSVPVEFAEDYLGSSFVMHNYYDAGIGATQILYDFGRNLGGFRAAKATAVAEDAAAQVELLEVQRDVRVAYVTARAASEQQRVAEDALANRKRHLAQVSEFIEMRSRPEIDLMQVRVEHANARVALINAQNASMTARLELNMAMGEQGDTNYELSRPIFPAVLGEDSELEPLLKEALEARPELMVLKRQQQATDMTVASVKGGFGPILAAGTDLTAISIELDQSAWNWRFGLTLTWPLYEGGLTKAQVREARMNQEGIASQVDAQRQQIRVEVEQARLAIRAAKAAIEASDEAIASARRRHELAEGRYEAGVGAILEMGDAQLALTAAGSQKVQAQFNLSAARAALVFALGRK
jgi:outer membrane protein